MDADAIFHWFLACDVCGDSFYPEDIEGELTCQNCGARGTICDGEEHEHDTGDPQPEEEREAIGDHPQWPANLTDEQLDQAWAMSFMLPKEQIEELKVEYARRDRAVPQGKIGLA